MTLLNRDGTPFRLVGAAELEQEWIHEKNLIFHNFVWEGIVIPNKNSKIQKRQPTVVAEPTPTPTLTPTPTPIPETPTEISEFENLVIIHCLPLIGQNAKTDKLYGDTYNQLKYGERSLFEALITDRSDFAISIWTSSTLNSKSGIINTIDYLKPGSIVFPSRYKDGGKFGDYRWWKVQNVSPQNNGVAITAVITEIQSSFD